MRQVPQECNEDAAVNTNTNGNWRSATSGVNTVNMPVQRHDVHEGSHADLHGVKPPMYVTKPVIFMEVTILGEHIALNLKL